MESTTLPRPKINPRAILITIILILLTALAVLLYLYFRLVLPPAAANKPRIPGITHIFTIYGDGADKLKRPNGVAVDKTGNIYIADTENGRIMVFDSSGQRLQRKIIVGEESKAKAESIFKRAKNERVKKLSEKEKKKFKMHGQVNYYPFSVSLDKNDNLYVASSISRNVFVYNSGGREIKRMRINDKPVNAVVQGGSLYVLTNKKILKYSLNGQLLSKWGRRGKAPGDFDGPMSLALDSKGNIFVSDTFNLRLQGFSKRGEVTWVLGRPPKDMDESNRVFGLPAGLAVGSDDNLYLVDAFHGTIHVISNKGKRLAELGQWGSEDGQLFYPSLITHVRDNVFLVADKYNNRVQELAITAPGTSGALIERFGCGQ